MNDQLAPPPDENTLVLPDSWLVRLYPRRGGVPVPEIRIKDSVAERMRRRIATIRSFLETVLDHEESEPELVERAREYLRGAADPVGAAVLSKIDSQATHQGLPLEKWVDAWVAEHGLAFAACAFAERGGITVELDLRRADFPHVARYSGWPDASMGMGPGWRRMRALLAVADERDYDEAVERLVDHRRSPMQRLVVSFLVPTRRDWVAECCADPPSRKYFDSDDPTMLWCALGSAEQLTLLSEWAHLARSERSVELLATVADGIGPAISPLLVAALDEESRDDVRATLLDALAILPTDEAFELMVARLDRKQVLPAMRAMMRRFPLRALRLLPAVAAGGSASAPLAKGLLDGHLRDRPELTATVLPRLPTAARAVIERALAEEVSAGALPPLLSEPPWTRRRAAKKPVVITGLTPPAEQRMSWAPGERAAWADSGGSSWWARAAADTDWAAEVTAYRNRRYSRITPACLLTQGPEDLIRPLLADWPPFANWSRFLSWGAADAVWLKRVAARFETVAFPLVSGMARSLPAGRGMVLLPFLNADVAALMADWLARLKSARPIAIAWFARHGAEAARMLVPAALGTAGKARRQAEGALHVIVAEVGAEEVVAAARAYGDEAASAIETLLATDPLDLLPARPPKVGDWADVSLLPQVLLRGGDHALPVTAAGHLITMLAMSKPEVYAGVDVVRELCDPGSLAEFSWALFLSWQAHGAPSKDGWALTQLGLMGDDETVRRLTPVIRAWPGEGGHKQAVNGLDVLAAIGSDAALTHLYGISQRVKFKALRTRAQEKIEEIATTLELTPEQLADRLIPDFGLDATGGLTLDYGPRRFVVGFDAHLKPYVADEDGERRKDLPKPGVDDDPELAPAAYKRFAALKKDVRTVAADQIRRLESAMVTRRRWSAAEFQALLAAHPLLWHIVRRLVWLSEDGGEVTAFRLAEDRTLADVADDVLTLADSASIGIAHPLKLGDELAAWSEVFTDYEILQPFPQLDRPVHTLTDEERAAGRLHRFEGRTVPSGTVLGLERRGWRRGEPQEGAVEFLITREVPGGHVIVIDLDPGIVAGHVDMNPEQTLEHVRIADRPGVHSMSSDSPFRFGELDPVTASEVLADLTELAGRVRSLTVHRGINESQ